MNVLILQTKFREHPMVMKWTEKVQAFFPLSCNLNCNFVNLIRLFMLYTKITHIVHLISLKVSSNNYTLILCTLDNDGPVPLLDFQLISIAIGIVLMLE